jgi:hypothetical protein
MRPLMMTTKSDSYLLCFSVGSDRSISMPIGQSVRDRMIFYFVHRTQKKRAFIIDFRLVDNT